MRDRWREKDPCPRCRVQGRWRPGQGGWYCDGCGCALGERLVSGGSARVAGRVRDPFEREELEKRGQLVLFE